MCKAHDDFIRIIGARENNLQDISLEIPKHQITVFTGVSGSGKSSLCLDTIAAQSRRELNETFPSFVQHYLPKYGRPQVERIEHLPVAIVIDQKHPAAGARSTVGTYTDAYALLRLLFSRVGKPFVGYAESFSFNHPSGSCPRCDGLGTVTELDVHKLVDFDKCLNDPDVIHFPTFVTGGWRWVRYAYSGLFDLEKKIRDYTPAELDLFLYAPRTKLKNPPANWPKSAQYEGLVTRIQRSIIKSEEGRHRQRAIETLAFTGTCPACGGTRVNDRVRRCKIQGCHIAQIVDMPIPQALAFVRALQDPLAVDLKRELEKRLGALIDIGLGYLTLSRATETLSGGEAQRIKIAKYIGSSLCDLVYILDEPSAGLHARDIERLKQSLYRLRDQGNTVLIVEHHREIIEMADYIVDMGPGAGANGGQVLFSGSYDQLLASGTDTGRLLGAQLPLKSALRQPQDWFSLSGVSYHNLNNIQVNLPIGVLTVIAGVAGSGKSSLMQAFVKACDEPVIEIGQKDIGVSLRSTPATYLGIQEAIRDLFARQTGAEKSLFSFNAQGACPACGGKGVIVSDMAFLDRIETVCELCHGARYHEKVLSYRVGGKSIAEVMALSVDEAINFFAGEKFIAKLRALSQVGLGYVCLNQALSTLSGGELQRVKLASNLGAKGRIFLIDEPSSGLHLHDIHYLAALFDRLVDQGNTLFLIEHSLEFIKRADYLIELGPGGGNEGGQLLFCGTPQQMLNCPQSVTAPYLRQQLPH